MREKKKKKGKRRTNRKVEQLVSLKMLCANELKYNV